MFDLRCQLYKILKLGGFEYDSNNCINSCNGCA